MCKLKLIQRHEIIMFCRCLVFPICHTYFKPLISTIANTAHKAHLLSLRSYDDIGHFPCVDHHPEKKSRITRDTRKTLVALLSQKLITSLPFCESVSIKLTNECTTIAIQKKIFLLCMFRFFEFSSSSERVFFSVFLNEKYPFTENV